MNNDQKKWNLVYKPCGALGAGVNQGFGPCQLQAGHGDVRHKDHNGHGFVTFSKGTAANQTTDMAKFAIGPGDKPFQHVKRCTCLTDDSVECDVHPKD